MSPDQILINALRCFLGKAPLYGSDRQVGKRYAEEVQLGTYDSPLRLFAREMASSARELDFDRGLSPYVTIPEPVRNSTGRVVGASFVGSKVKRKHDILKTFRTGDET